MGRPSHGRPNLRERRSIRTGQLITESRISVTPWRVGLRSLNLRSGFLSSENLFQLPVHPVSSSKSATAIAASDFNADQSRPAEIERFYWDQQKSLFAEVT